MEALLKPTSALTPRRLAQSDGNRKNRKIRPSRESHGIALLENESFNTRHPNPLTAHQKTSRRLQRALERLFHSPPLTADGKPAEVSFRYKLMGKPERDRRKEAIEFEAAVSRISEPERQAKLAEIDKVFNRDASLAKAYGLRVGATFYTGYVGTGKSRQFVAWNGRGFALGKDENGRLLRDDPANNLVAKNKTSEGTTKSSPGVIGVIRAIGSEQLAPVVPFKMPDLSTIESGVISVAARENSENRVPRADPASQSTRTSAAIVTEMEIAFGDKWVKLPPVAPERPSFPVTGNPSTAADGTAKTKHQPVTSRSFEKPQQPEIKRSWGERIAAFVEPVTKSVLRLWNILTDTLRTKDLVQYDREIELPTARERANFEHQSFDARMRLRHLVVVGANRSSQAEQGEPFFPAKDGHVAAFVGNESVRRGGLNFEGFEKLFQDLTPRVMSAGPSSRFQKR